MSVDLHVFLSPDRMPSPSAWAQAISTAGFDVVLDQDFEPSSFSGFLPCTYKGKPAGFEYFFQVLAEPELSRWGIADPARPLCITFATRSDFREFASSMISAAVLASMADGLLRDADGTTLIAASSAVPWAREGEHSIQQDIESQDLRASTARSNPVPTAEKRPWWKLW